VAGAVSDGASDPRPAQVPKAVAELPRQVREELTRRLRRKKHAFRADDVQVVEPPLLRRAVGASALGNCMEWFDFGVYSHLAATIGSTARSPWSVRGGSGRN
jgi:MFS transporter, MHS family, proline/betaine transporter